MTDVHGPKLGTSVEQVLDGWETAQEDLTVRGWRRPYAYDVHQSREFFHGADGVYVAVVARGCTPGCRRATEAELDELWRNVAAGAVEIYLRGTCDSYADRRADRKVLHRATGKRLQDSI